MAFIDIIAEDKATGATANMYQQARDRFGYLPNMTKVFSHRPEVMDAWNALLASIRGNIELRRYELATIAAAKALRSSYCMLAHGSVLLNQFYNAEELQAIVDDPETSRLDETDKAIMRFAYKVAAEASTISETDIADLRGHGLTDAEIFDVATTAAVRCFFSKTLDALGAQPDATYHTLEEGLKTALLVGRPIEMPVQE